MNGENIRALRLSKNWTQRDLADYLGVEQATISRLESDEWEPSRPVRKLLEILNGSAPISPERAEAIRYGGG